MNLPKSSLAVAIVMSLLPLRSASSAEAKPKPENKPKPAAKKEEKKPAPKPAAKKPEAKKKAPPKESLTVKDLALREAAECDANYNGRIDGSEMTSLRQAQRSNPKSYLYLFDDNSNQYLEDSELSKIRFTPKKKPDPSKSKTAGSAKKDPFWDSPPAGSQMGKKKKK